MCIDLRGLDKAAVLAALYNASNAQDRFGNSTDRMTVEEAQSFLDIGPTCFGYIRGRPMHIDLSGDTLQTAYYDEVNFPGAAAKAIEPLSGGFSYDDLSEAKLGQRDESGNPVGTPPEDSRPIELELGRLAQEISRASQRLSALESNVSELMEALGEELDLESNGSLVDDGAQELVDRMALREEEG